VKFTRYSLFLPPLPSWIFFFFEFILS
jgi:hypothetical protein